MPHSLRKVEINGGVVSEIGVAGSWRLALPPVPRGYGDAQIDDYSGRRRRDYPWRHGTSLRLEARFSPGRDSLAGTAGFGFWNAPFGPGTGPLPELPQAVWFFYGSPRNDLPVAPVGEAGNGWFASTIDAGRPRALAWAPFAIPVVLLNQAPWLRRRLWPLVRRSLAMNFQRLDAAMDEWHSYQLDWQDSSCVFRVDGQVVLQTSDSPRGPLGFVAWIDNQYLAATPTGRFRWGTEATTHQQELELRGLQLEQH
jgi:hypothetical protein